MTREATPLLSAEGLTKVFATRVRGSWSRRAAGVRRAVSDVSFELHRGEVLGIVGESGSGKTTVARMLLRLIEPTSGRILLRGRDVMSLTSLEARSILRPAVRMIFQDPDASLNPGYTIGFGLARALEMHAGGTPVNIAGTVATLLHRVGLNDSFAAKYPDELSGGEKRRVGICRALATDPEVIVADEPLSGLDVVLQERVLELLKSEQQTRQFGLILVSHDLDRVNQVCDRVIVMHGGRVVEQATLRRNAGPVREQYQHPYSVLLQQARVDVREFDAVDVPVALGEPATNGALERSIEAGCTFAPSCARRLSLGDPKICWEDVPRLVAVADDQVVACHFANDPAMKASADHSAHVAALMAN